ncbi:MAG: hypothetical protein JRG91_16260, partial [Deltaproteobacteria bacterium]|nr:hypothetical protein [Deltaproteobacteria bacterium]
VFECATLTCESGACVATADDGAACDFVFDVCLSPGVCDELGICRPGPATPPPGNDTCDSATAVTASGGSASLTGLTTLCAEDDDEPGCVHPALDGPDVAFQLGYTVPADRWQLTSWNVWVEAGDHPDPILFAMSDCPGSGGVELACNDDCIDDDRIDCSSLGTRDPAVNLGVQPDGSGMQFKLFVDGYRYRSGTFDFHALRGDHDNNPCSSAHENVNMVDATGGGVFRGNLNGYRNDITSTTGAHISLNCHDPPLMDMGSDDAWPAYAWFYVEPEADATYCIWTDESGTTAPPTSVADTVIQIFELTDAACTAIRYDVGCDGGTGPGGARFELSAPAGRAHAITVSNYEAPTGGSYTLHVDVGACP